MLSRAAQASRLGLMASRLARPIATPAIRARPAPPPFAASPWIRSYSDSKDPLKRKPVEPSQSNEPDFDAVQSDIRKAEEKTPESEKDAEIPFHKLPDLTQGIPSTLEYELGGKDKDSQNALQESPESEGGQGRGRERSEYVSTTEQNRKWWTRFSLVMTAIGATGTLLYFGRSFDPIEAERFPDITNSQGPVGFWERAKARWNDSVSFYQEPSFEKLLPDPDASFERPYTLCLSLDDLLIHSEWSREHGWRVAKRPGVDYFIRYLSQYYELVLFTSVPFATGEPVVRKLDPFRFIMWPLYREATKFQDGEIVKVSPGIQFNNVC